MPCLKIFTSLAKEKIPSNFVYRIVPVLAKTLKKPEDKFVIMVSTDCTVSFYGKQTLKPGVVATLESIGNLGAQENQVITKEVMAFMQKELGIDPENFFLTFYDLRSQDVGKGITYA